jgi:hypothetical protein
LNFIGSKELVQFNVLDYTMTATEDASRIFIKTKFKRIFIYHLTNTYMPTTTLLIIALVTLYFDQSKMELATG